MSKQSSAAWSNDQWLTRLSDAGPDAVEAHQGLLFLLRKGLRRALNDRPEALAWVDDFVQDATLRILRDLHQFRGESRFSTWALSIAIRVALDELRRKRWQDVSLETLMSAGDSYHPTTLQSYDANVDRRRIFEMLHRAIDMHLTAKQREALIAEFRGVPQTEIARHLGITRNALYKLTHDARKSLKHHLPEAGITMERMRWAIEGESDETH